MPDDKPDDVPDGQDQVPEVTCAGGLSLPPISASGGTPDQE